MSAISHVWPYEGLLQANMVASPSARSGFASPNAPHTKQNFNKPVCKQKSFSDVGNHFSTTPNNSRLKRQHSSPQSMSPQYQSYSPSPKNGSGQFKGHGHVKTPGHKGRYSPKPLFSSTPSRPASAGTASSPLPRSSPRTVPFKNPSYNNSAVNRSAASTPPNGRSRNHSTCSSTMSVSPTPSGYSSPRSSCSPGRTSPNNYASAKCYEAPLACELPKPPVQWHSFDMGCHEEARIMAADASMELKMMLNVVS